MAPTAETHRETTGRAFPLRVTGAEPPWIEQNGSRWLSFGGCDYLALSRAPEVILAAREALDTYPVSTSASRTTTGNADVHGALEDDLRQLLNVEDLVLCPDGYTANLVAAQALASTGRFRRAWIADRAHASLEAAARIGDFPIDRGDPARARGDGPRVFMTDGVFTADGRVAPVLDLLGETSDDDVLVVDDCHGVSTIGSRGAGSLSHHGLVADPRVVVTGTLAKGIGTAGGFVGGSREIVARARGGSSAFVGTTPPSPILASAARAALRVMRTDGPRHHRLRSASRHLHRRLASLGLGDGGSITPIAAFAGTTSQITALKDLANSASLIIPVMTYPGGPAPEYVRVSVTSAHTTQDVDRLVDVIERAFA